MITDLTETKSDSHHIAPTCLNQKSFHNLIQMPFRNQTALEATRTVHNIQVVSSDAEIVVKLVPVYVLRVTFYHQVRADS